LITALLTTLPAWNTFDPLPVLDARADKKDKKIPSDKTADDIDKVFEDSTPNTKNLPE